MPIAARHQNSSSSSSNLSTQRVGREGAGYLPERWKFQQKVTKGNNPLEKRQQEKLESQRQFAAKCRGGRTFGWREEAAALEKPAGALGIETVVISSCADLPL